MNDPVDSVRAYFPARIYLEDGTEIEAPTILHPDGTVSIELGELAGQKFTFLGYSLGIQESSNWILPQEYQRNGGHTGLESNIIKPLIIELSTTDGFMGGSFKPPRKRNRRK